MSGTYGQPDVTYGQPGATYGWFTTDPYVDPGPGSVEASVRVVGSVSATVRVPPD